MLLLLVLALPAATAGGPASREEWPKKDAGTAAPPVSTRESFFRLCPGMMLREVESLLGRPSPIISIRGGRRMVCDWYGTDIRISRVFSWPEGAWHDRLIDGHMRDRASDDMLATTVNDYRWQYCRWLAERSYGPIP